MWVSVSSAGQSSFGLVFSLKSFYKMVSCAFPW